MEPERELTFEFPGNDGEARTTGGVEVPPTEEEERELLSTAPLRDEVGGRVGLLRDRGAGEEGTERALVGWVRRGEAVPDDEGFSAQGGSDESYIER